MRSWRCTSRGLCPEGANGVTHHIRLSAPSAFAPPHRRENTERPVTVTQGTNTVVGSDPRRIVAEVLTILDGKGKAGRVPELWGGHAAERVVTVLRK